jgi:hypothetical protein
MTSVLTRPLPTDTSARAPTPPRRQAEIVPPPVDVVDQWGMHSFPASDPPSNW